MLLTIMTIVMDILWIFVMREVWAGKPLKNANSWKAFENIRSFTLFLSGFLTLCSIGDFHFGFDAGPEAGADRRTTEVSIFLRF